MGYRPWCLVDLFKHVSESGYPGHHGSIDQVRDFETILNHENLPDSKKAVMTVGHLFPLFATLDATEDDDSVEVLNDYCGLGSMSVTGYLFTEKRKTS